MGQSETKEKTESTNRKIINDFNGLENFGNTCYCNSVLISLFFCEIFRKNVLEYNQENLLNLLIELKELFKLLSDKSQSNTKQLKSFIIKLRKENVLFSNNHQQDAHEFLNYLLNHISEILKDSNNFINSIFQGTLSNETRCINCDHKSSRDEPFLDLSIELQGNTSISNCLKEFSKNELLKGNDKFFCDECNSLQEAQKSLKIKKLPNVFILHLKRFKYSEEKNEYKKLHDRITFPFELKIEESSFQLFSIIVHIGKNLTNGHYISIIKSNDIWYCFDDTRVSKCSDKDIQSLFGIPNHLERTETGYILFYMKTK